MRLHFNSIDDFALTLKLVFAMGSRFIKFLCTFLVRVILRECWRKKLKITTVKFLVDKLINKLANCLSIALPQLFDLDVFYVW